MLASAAIINCVALLIAFLFYRKSAAKFPYLKAVSLYNFVLWIITGLFAWRFVIKVTLTSPIYEFAQFVITVIALQCIINICAHVLARFADH